MTILKKEFSNPSQDFVRVLAKQVYAGVCTQRIIDEFTELTKKSINTLISEMIADRLENALKTETTHRQQEQNEKEDKQEKEELPEGIVAYTEDGVITTQEEMDGFNIVRAIIYENIENIERIVHRDTKSYFGVLFDDNNRKPICRLHLNSETNKYISVFDNNRKEVKHRIESISDIYKYSEELKAILQYYLNE